jgi:hypothetical protein
MKSCGLRATLDFGMIETLQDLTSAATEKKNGSCEGGRPRQSRFLEAFVKVDNEIAKIAN